MKKPGVLDWCALIILGVVSIRLSKWLVKSAWLTHFQSPEIMDNIIEPVLVVVLIVGSLWLWAKMRDLPLVADTTWDDWSRIRQRGMWHYVIVHWTVKFGFMVATIFTLSAWIANIIFDRLTLSSFVEPLSLFVVFPSFGFLLGLAAWNVTEDQYSKRGKQALKAD